MNDEIIDMQETLAFQQAEIDRLSEEFYAQQKEIRLLRQMIEHLKDRLNNDDEGDAQALMENRPPPHY